MTVLLAACVTAASAAAPDAPEGQVRQFLSKYRSLQFSGLPDPREARTLAPYLSARLNDQMRRAWTVQRRFAVRHKDEKPPMIEGDLFSSLFEGPTSFETGETRIESDRATVLVRFSYADSGGTTSWSDQYELVRKPKGAGWAIDDVKYLGNWPFAPKGRLSEGLKDVISLKY
jgi:hypothetical protein